MAERQQYLTLAVRDYLNGGGKLVHAGESAQHQGLLGISDAVGGLYYGLDGDPTAECVIQTVPGFFEDCLILADDFRQYWLGGFARVDVPSPESVAGIAEPIEGYEGEFGGPQPRTTRSTRPASSSRPARCCRSGSSRSSRARLPRVLPRRQPSAVRARGGRAVRGRAAR